MSKNKRKINKIISISLLVFGVLIIVGIINQSPKTKSPLAGMSAVVYRSVTCGCCYNYIKYLEGLGLNVEEKLVNNISDVKKELNIPNKLSSCHTTKIGGYIVEGHIPIEGIEKLIAEKPAIAGIALPDMPSGSPGMPGAKYGSFDISSFTATGSSSPYLSL